MRKKERVGYQAACGSGDLKQDTERYSIPDAYIIKRRPYTHTWWKELKKIIWTLKKIYTPRMGIIKNRDQAVVQDNYERAYSVSNQDWVRERSGKQYEVIYGDQTFLVSGTDCNTIRIEIIYNWIRKLEANKVLEVGSGRGKNLIALLKQDSSLQLTGLERSFEGVKRSKEWGTKINFIQGDAQKLPFADHSFDVAFTNQVLEQIPHNYKTVVAEMKRVAKYCIFVEEFKEAQNISDWLWIKHKDFFRSSYRVIDKNPLYFSSDIPRSKSKYGLGLLVIRGNG